MSKSQLSFNIIDKLIEFKASNADINLLFYISTIADEWGRVNSLYYKDVCRILNISSQTFYNCVDFLENNNLIQRTNTGTSNWGRIDLIILNNVYISKESFSNQYLNINRFSALLCSKEFRESNVNIKYMILRLLKMHRNNESKKFSINKLLEYSGIKSITLLLKYIEVLKTWFDIKKKNDYVFYINLKDNFSIPKTVAKEVFLKNKLENWCREFKICYTLSDFNNTLYLFHQYHKHINILLSVLQEIALQYHSLEYKLINKKTSECINSKTVVQN